MQQLSFQANKARKVHHLVTVTKARVLRKPQQRAHNELTGTSRIFPNILSLIIVHEARLCFMNLCY